MWGRKKSTNTSSVTWTLAGLHCPACAMNIDGALEDTPGVLAAKTSYAQSQVTIDFDQQQVTEQQLQTVIRETGYDLAEQISDSQIST